MMIFGADWMESFIGTVSNIVSSQSENVAHTILYVVRVGRKAADDGWDGASSSVKFWVRNSKPWPARRSKMTTPARVAAH
jgi:hypothetical protein